MGNQLEKNMNTEAEIGLLFEGFMGMITNFMIPDSLFRYLKLITCICVQILMTIMSPIMLCFR